MSSVLVARFERRSALAPIVRAALDVDVVYVALPEAPPAGRNVLQLYVADELVAAVSADEQHPHRIARSVARIARTIEAKWEGAMLTAWSSASV